MMTSLPFPRGIPWLAVGGRSPGSRRACRRAFPGALGRSQWPGAAGLSGYSGGSAPVLHRLPYATDLCTRPRITAARWCPPLNRSARSLVRAAMSQNGAVPKKRDRRIRPGPLPARLEEARPERARLARHPEPSAHGRRRDVHALHDGHRDPHGHLPARPARHPRRRRSPGHGVPLLLGLRGALARRGVLRFPARLRHRGARRAEASGRLHPHAHPARPRPSCCASGSASATSSACCPRCSARWSCATSSPCT